MNGDDVEVEAGDVEKVAAIVDDLGMESAYMTMVLNMNKNLRDDDDFKRYNNIKP